ncbi:MAG: DUF6320 domain-containing protein [Lachnospiraceae bacterium]|nr:DUF6320 domain-containing protein [Lachnospiraceae bacterium]
MNKCKKCGVAINDEATRCLFCGMVLSGDDGGAGNIYPDIRNKTRMLKRIINIASYFGIVLEIILAVVNYYNYYGIKWSIITGGAIFYIILTLQYTINKRNGHIKKIFVQMLGAMLLVVVIDFALGFSGWSFNMGIPLIILLLDVVILLCMVINFNNWQSYLLMQIFTLAISIIHMALYLAGLVSGPVLPWVTFGVSAVIFTSCLVIGDKKAKSELKRRFYI